MAEMFAASLRGFAQVTTNGHGEVTVNHPDLNRHIHFSPEQAHEFAILLLKKALEAYREKKL